ncbi:hypothetical protein SAMN04487983_103286 [Streptomyces sp. yr375]|uniref:hypothetical protein n=1 Tax=Streptomyces sp. yr375 TaxID=1761906 RepID=UPI0008D8612E|nr:hypothetical protein [Streptomyces sp. yr375]SES14035.1 hypothetical protein SAMN04487983_103286 [Streptomyces sp. yr375]
MRTTRDARRPIRRRGRVLATTLALLTSVALTGCGSDTPDDDHHQQQEQKAVAAPTTRAERTSTVDAGGQPEGVALRGCPFVVHDVQHADVAVTCLSVHERLPTGTQVTMRCWTDTDTGTLGDWGRALKGEPRVQRWFYVTVADGEHAGQSGYVYSDLVPRTEQTKTPHCTPEILQKYPYSPHVEPEPLKLEITGTCTTQGGTLTGRSSGFVGDEYAVTAYYPDGREYPLASNSTSARADGSVPWTWSCAGDPAGTYTTEISTEDGRETTGRVPFTIGTPTPRPPTQPTPTPTPPPTPTRTPTPTPATPKPVSVTVSNLVTNGAEQMREDTPAYLSTRTVGSCRKLGCKLDGTEMTSGFVAQAICQLTGDRITNGQNDNTIDDTNPGLYSSTLWYRIRWSDGREGYLSTVWLTPTNHNAPNLPTC